VSAVFAAASLVLLALALLLLPSTTWRAAECAFVAVHAVAHGAAARTVTSSRRGSGDATAVHLRAFWLGAALSSASAALRWAEGSLLLPDDPLAFAGLLVSLPLAYAAVAGLIAHDAGRGDDAEPEQRGVEAPITSYAAASFLSVSAGREEADGGKDSNCFNGCDAKISFHHAVDVVFFLELLLQKSVRFSTTLLCFSA
jgi:ATP-binding cassette, subfamily C (CFTR/MRP), member 1